jgi:hypothetical protein
MGVPMTQTATPSMVTSGYRFLPGERRFVAIDIHLDESKLAAFERAAQRIPGGMSRMAPPALNKAADEMKTWLYREIAARMAVTRTKSIKDRLLVRPLASATSWISGVRIGLSRLTVASFKTRRTRYMVYWTPEMGHGWREIPRAFWQAGYTHSKTSERIEVEQVYRRVKSGEKGFMSAGINRAGNVVQATAAGDIVRRYSIKVMRGPSVAMAFSRDRILPGRAGITGNMILTKKLASQVARFVVAEVPA